MFTPRSIKLSLLTVCAFWAAPFVSAQAQSFTDVAVGEFHICGLSDGGEVDCVTDATTTRFDEPNDLPLITDITAGLQHTCGITVDGGAVCWGSTAFGVLDVPELDAPLVSISAGLNHTCAIDELNRAVCWGLNDNEQTEVPGDGFGENGLGFLEVRGSQNTTCGIELDGKVTCWSTDPTRLDTSSLTGNYIDLGVTRFTACALEDTGVIDCWVGAFDPPSNGPYSDLTVTSQSICGLNEFGGIDCTTRPGGSGSDLSLYESGSEFVSLEAQSSIRFGRNNNVCGLTVNSTIECLDVSSLVDLPGSGSNNPELSINLNLTAIVSPLRDDTLVELLWTPLSGGLPLTRIEIFRDNELLSTTSAGASYPDFILSGFASSTVAYRVRAIDEDGNVGEFSNSITVDLSNNTVETANTLSLNDLPVPPNFINSLTFNFFSGTVGLLSWDGSRAGENGVKGYEIRINNESVELTDGNSFLFQDFVPLECVLLTVRAISDDNEILDTRSVVGFPFSTQFPGRSECTRG